MLHLFSLPYQHFFCPLPRPAIWNTAIRYRQTLRRRRRLVMYILLTNTSGKHAARPLHFSPSYQRK